MKTSISILALILLTACQNTPRLEDDTRYVKLATIVEIHEFSEVERKQAQANKPNESGVSVSIGMGVGFGSRGMMFGMDSLMEGRPEKREEPPQVAKGASRYTVQALGSDTRTEVMSYGKYKLGDCVKVLMGHPTEYPRFFELKPGEHC